MREAAIVSTARTPIGRAYRGVFNNTDAPTMGGHVIKHAVSRAGINPKQVEDVIMGCAMGQGTQSPNIARLCALSGDLPVTTAGMTLDRQCSSGMMAIATASKSIMAGEHEVMVAGGIESISLVQNEHANTYRMIDENLVSKHKHVYMLMLDTAEVVANRYEVSREAQDEYAFQSQQRTSLAQDARKFDDEIVEYLASCSGGDIHASENFIEIAIKCGSDLEDPEEIERHYLRSFKEVSDDEDVDFPEAIEVVWVMEETLKPTQLAKFKKELVEHFTNNLESEVMNLSFEYKWGGKKKFDSGDKEGAISDWQKAADLGDEEAAKWIQEVSS